MSDLARRIEDASLAAWPALNGIVLDGWIVRWSEGYTKRANSVTPLLPSREEPTPKIERCERIYGEAELPPIFRLPSLEDHELLERELADRGYVEVDPTLVLTLELFGAEATADPPLREVAPDEWLDRFGAFTGPEAADHREPHRRILEAIPRGRRLVVLEDEDRIAACGMTVTDGELCGLFDLVTDPGLRSRGLGTRLTFGLLALARAEGATHAYLQVVEANTPARRVYDKLGFREAYRYRYRIRK